MATMPQNRVSASLTPEDIAAVMAAIETVKQRLPFLIDLSKEERRTMLKMGDDSRGFVFKMMELIQQNPDFLPRSFDIEEMRKDVELLKVLYPVLVAVSQLHELLQDTLMEVGSEAYAAALVGYRYAKDANLDGADDLLDDISRRFARKSSPKSLAKVDPVQDQN